MKRALSILLAGAMLGAAAYGLAYFRRTAEARALQEEQHPELAWLKQEFGLDVREFERIRTLHEGYLPQCARMCAKIAAASEELESLVVATNQVTPAISEKLMEIGRLRQECHGQMLAHFYAVSQAMPVEQGKRYLLRMQQLTSPSSMRDHAASDSAQPPEHAHH